MEEHECKSDHNIAITARIRSGFLLLIPNPVRTWSVME